MKIKTNNDEIIRRKDTYLEVLTCAIAKRVTDKKLYQRLCNLWFAHHRGKHFLGPRLGVKKYSSKDAKSGADFRSQEASSLLENNHEATVLDHCVPLSVIKQKLLELRDPSFEDVEKILKEYYALALITNEQHNMLEEKYKQKMPSKWDGINLKARYEAAGIEVS